MDIGLTEGSSDATTAVIVSPFTSPPLSSAGEVVKRLEDLLLGAALILLVSWLMVGIAVTIKLTSRGPVLFRQDRRGRYNTTFGCFKFRTMYHASTDHDCLKQTEYDDPRVTLFGRFLRRHSLDELPQLFNVMLGDMSLVGPRPHAFGTSVDGLLLPDLCDQYLHRYHVRPGLTGWAQVNGWRGILDTRDKLEQRVAHDLHYIANWSLSLDLKILIKTFTCLFADERAY